MLTSREAIAKHITPEIREAAARATWKQAEDIEKLLDYIAYCEMNTFCTSSEMARSYNESKYRYLCELQAIIETI